MVKKKLYLVAGFVVVVAAVLLFYFTRSSIVLGEKSVYDVAAAEGFSFAVEGVKEDVIEIKLRNASLKTLYWGSPYALEKNVDDVWYSVEPQMPDDVKGMWNDMLYYLDGGGESVISISLKFYGELPKGSYRVVKQFSFEGQNVSEGSCVAAEFLVE